MGSRRVKRVGSGQLAGKKESWELVRKDGSLIAFGMTGGEVKWLENNMFCMIVERLLRFLNFFYCRNGR